MKKILINSIIGMTLASVLLSASTQLAYAAPLDYMDNNIVSESKEVRRCEESYQYRVHNGVIEKRLWCHTCGIWVTGWLPA